MMKQRKIIKAGAQLLWAKIARKRIPFQVSIRVTEACNQQCNYCIGDFNRRGIQMPKIDQLFEVIDGFADLGTKHITLIGGEPLLRDDINNIVCHIKKHNIHCSLTTNGRLIDQNSEVLKNLDLLSISIDGTEQTHDKYRGEGSYLAAWHCLEIAKKNGVPVQLICTVTDLTELDLSHLRELSERYNCMLTFELLNPLFEKEGTSSLRPEDIGPEKSKILLNYFINNQNPYLLLNSSVLKYVHDWPFSYKKFRVFKDEIPPNFKPLHCYAGRFTAVVEANGDLVPCCILRNDYKPVNVFKLGAKTAWKQMPINNCVTCRSLGCNMQNALFSLDLKAIGNFLKTIITTNQS